MEAIIKILVGLFLFAASLSYLYRPSLVLKVNAIFREVIFSDNFLLHYRRRWGMLLFVGALLFLYSGFKNLDSSPLLDESGGHGQMTQAYRNYYLGRYTDTVKICKVVLRDRPEDPHALFLLKQAQSKMTQESPDPQSTGTVASH